jgi:hypothetical protein
MRSVARLVSNQDASSRVTRRRTAPAPLRPATAARLPAAWRGLMLLTCLLAGLFCAGQASALERLFPPITKRGVMSTEAYPVFHIDGKERRLSPGAWIRNENNTIDMPASLRGRKFVVNYTENGEGDIDRVWILTGAEAGRKLPDPKTVLPLPVQ